MPKASHMNASEQERSLKIAIDMFKDDGRPRVSTVARKLMGRIIRWFDDKHFGFICTNDGNDDVYVHESALSEDLCGVEEKVGFLVQFDIVARETFARVTQMSSCKKSARSVQLLAEPELTGRLSWRGTCGFVWTEEGSKYFCTETNFLKDGLSLDTGAMVQFLAAKDEKGLRAVRISPSATQIGVEDMREGPKFFITETAVDGRIVTLNSDKGFGFIRPKGRGADVHFKLNEQAPGLCLFVGAKVLFNVKDTEGWLSACDITVLGQNSRSQQLQDVLAKVDACISRNTAEVEADNSKKKIIQDPCRHVDWQDRKHGSIAPPSAVSVAAPLPSRKIQEPKREDDEQSTVSTAAETVAGAESWLLAQLG